MICASHMMAACLCGIENNLGCLVTPLRACYNKADSHTDLLSTSIGSGQSTDRRKEVVSLSPFSQGHWF